MQIVFSIDVTLEQDEVEVGQIPSVSGLIASKKGRPPRLPQIMTPPKSIIVMGGCASTLLVHVRLFALLLFLYAKHFVSMPPHCLEKTGSQPSSQPSFNHNPS